MTVRFWDYAPPNTTLRVKVRQKAKREFPNPFEPPPPPPEPSPYDALDMEAQRYEPPSFPQAPEGISPGELEINPFAEAGQFSGPRDVLTLGSQGAIRRPYEPPNISQKPSGVDIARGLLPWTREQFEALERQKEERQRSTVAGIPGELRSTFSPTAEEAAELARSPIMQATGGLMGLPVQGVVRAGTVASHFLPVGSQVDTGAIPFLTQAAKTLRPGLASEAGGIRVPKGGGKGATPGVRPLSEGIPANLPKTPEDMYRYARGVLATDQLAQGNMAVTSPRLTTKQRAQWQSVVKKAEGEHPEWKAAYEKSLPGQAPLAQAQGGGQIVPPPAAESATAKAASEAAAKGAGVVPAGQARGTKQTLAQLDEIKRQQQVRQYEEGLQASQKEIADIAVGRDVAAHVAADMPYERLVKDESAMRGLLGWYYEKVGNPGMAHRIETGDTIPRVELSKAHRMAQAEFGVSKGGVAPIEGVLPQKQAPPPEPVRAIGLPQGEAALQPLTEGVTPRAQQAPTAAAPPPGGGATPRPPEATTPPAPATPGLQAAGEPPRGGEPPRLTAEQSDGAIRRFSAYLVSPKSEEAWTLTQELRKQERATRAKALQQRLDQLMGEGRSTEEAISQAVKETMSGRLPGSKGFSEVYADNMREALFAKVFHVLQGDEYELMSTSEALRNALLGKAIPRTPGAKGGSAYTRLLRVFGQDSSVMKMLEKAKKLEAQLNDALLHAPSPPWKDFEVPPSVPFGVPRLGEQGWSDLGMVIPNRTPAQTALAAEQLKIYLNEQRQFIEAQRKSVGLTWDTWIQQRNLPKEFAEYPPESILHGGQQKTLPGMEQADWQRTMMAETRTQEQLEAAQWELSRQEQRAAGQTEFDFPPPAPPPTKPPITESMIPPPQRNIVLRALKEAGLTIRDLGNFWRANKATLDNSWWRQNAMLLGKDRRAFWNATVESWKAMFQKDGGKASWEKIRNDPLFHLYEKIDLDFLRPPSLTPEQAAWRGVEEYGFTQANRPLARLAGKLPWIKHPQRAFITGTNEHNWAIFKGFYKKMLEINQELAAGKIKLKPGESFSIEKQLKDYGRMLEDMTGRAQLGPLKVLSPAMNNGFFSMRFALSRGLVGRNLFSANPYVRKEAWNLFARFTGGITAIEMAGEQMGLWEIGKEKNSTLGKIRVGNTWIDPWGGHQQYVVFAARMLTGKNTSLTGQEYPVSRWETFGRLVRGKEAPLGGFVTDLLAKQDYLGRKVDLGSGTQWAERVAPMVPWDAYEAFKESGPGVALATLPFSVQGIGVTSYSNPLDKLAKEKGQSDFRSLQETSPKEASQLKLSPEGRIAIREEGKVVSEQQKAKEADYDRQKLSDQALDEGRKTPSQWRDDLKQARDRKAGANNYKELLQPFQDKPPKDDNEKARQGYYKLWQSFDEEKNGQYDKAGNLLKQGTGVDPPDLGIRLDTYISNLTAEQRKSLMDNLHPQATEKVNEYYRDIEKLKPYFAIQDKMERDNPILAAQLRKIKMAEERNDKVEVMKLRSQMPGVVAWENQIKVARNTMRYTNQDIDSILKKWGYTSTYMNPANREKEIREQTEKYRQLQAAGVR